MTFFYQSFNCNITTFKSRAKVNIYDVYQCITMVGVYLLVNFCLH
ncbi:protein of unknown function [Chryseobacterium sp. JV274]|nr:protein of unknown function [Chryseobacterium sp. JV274]